jgi:hypothetical protein
MQRIQTAINWFCLGSEISHFFCCGLPIIFSLLGLLASAGLTAAMPVGLESLHHTMHNYERPLIFVSLGILMMGWVLHFIAYRLDCRAEGCAREHEPCAPKKRRSGKVLIIATILFALNLVAYMALHN